MVLITSTSLALLPEATDLGPLGGVQICLRVATCFASMLVPKHK